MTEATALLDALDETAEGRSTVTVGRVNDRIGHRGSGALLLLPAAIELTPIGGIPGVPTLLAVLIAVVAVQIAMGRGEMWLPGPLERRGIAAEKLSKGVSWLRPAARWSDRHLGRHLHILVHGPAARVSALVVVALCCTIPPLELVPFASSIPMGAIALFGLALLVRDGRVMVLAWLAFAAALGGVWWLLS